MARSDVDLVKMLKGRVIELQSRLAEALTQADKASQYKNMFHVLKDGFIKLRDERDAFKRRLVELGYGSFVAEIEARRGERPEPLVRP